MHLSPSLLNMARDDSTWKLVHGGVEQLQGVGALVEQLHVLLAKALVISQFRIVDIHSVVRHVQLVAKPL